MLGAFWTQNSIKRNELTSRYEPIQPFVLLAAAEWIGCEIFIDVGANIGFYSVLFGLSGKINEAHAFEASSAAFAELEHNLVMNRLDFVKAHKAAVSSAQGQLILLIKSPLSGANAIGGSTFHDESSYSSKESVYATTLDDMFTWSGRKVALKIDVEGHENYVLDGSRKLLSENECIIQAECYRNAYSNTNKQLSDLGYECFASIGNDFYFTNSSRIDGPAKAQIFELAANRLVDTNLGRWPVHNANEDALEVNVSRNKDKVKVRCVPNPSYFTGKTEYAFYLRKNGKKEQVLWYSDKSSTVFNIPEADVALYSISAFCRDEKFHAKKIMVTKPVR